MGNVKAKEESETMTDVSISKSFWSLEPALILHSASAIFTFMIVQDFMIDRACEVNLGFEGKVCQALENKQSEAFPDAEDQMQKLIGAALMTRTVLENLCPMFLVILVGAWSDTYGRKLPILFVVASFIFQDCLLLLCTLSPKATGVWTIAVISSVFVSLSGNQACFMMSSFSYAIDHTKKESKTLRTAITHSSFILGLTLGLFSSAGLSKIGLEYSVLFLLAMSTEIFAFLYLFIMMKNPKEHIIKSKAAKQLFQDLFDVGRIKEASAAIFKPRAGSTRMKLLALLLVHAAALTPMVGEVGVLYLFGRYQFGWQASDFGAFMAYRTIVAFISAFISMGFFAKCLKLNDQKIGIVAGVSFVLPSVIFSVAQDPAVMYLGSLINLFAGGLLVAPRATISKMVPSSDMGKVNAFMASLESLTPIIAGPMYTYVYTSNLHRFPGSFFLLSAVSVVPSILVHTWLINDRTEKLK